MDDPAPNITEVIVGSNDYRLTTGQVMRLPPTCAAMMARTVRGARHAALNQTRTRSMPPRLARAT